jgi:hypothetical protein
MPESTKPTKALRTEPYRVCIAAAVYDRFTETIGPEGEPKVVRVRDHGVFGQTIELTDREAHRLQALGAVKPVDEPLSYAEMTDKQLDGEVKDRGIAVVSSGADPAQPLRTDKINALNLFDQARGGQQAVVPAEFSTAPGDDPPPPADEDGADQEDLDALTREELNELAAAHGVGSPEDLPNKGAVVDAIEAKRAEQAEQA